MNSKTIIGILCAALLATMLLKDCTGSLPDFNPVNGDSIAAIYQQQIDSMTVVQIGIERELSVAKQVIQSDSAAIAKANTTLKQSTAKVRQLLTVNAELKAANDTLGLLSNCDELVESNYTLLSRVDSLTALIPQYQQAIDDLVTVYDEALTAANDKALKLTEFNSAMRSALEECNSRGIAVSEASKSQLRKAQKKGFFNGVAAGVVATIIGGLLITH